MQKQGKVSINETNTLQDIKDEKLKIYSIDDVLDYEVLEVDENIEKLIRTGRKIENKYFIKDKVIFKDKNSKLLGIYEVENDILKVWKNFV